MSRQLLIKLALSLTVALPFFVRDNQFQVANAQQIAATGSEGASQIKGLKLSPNGNRMKLEIETAGGSRPQVFFTQQGTAWVGDITNAQLQINPGQNSFRQEAPVPGVSFVEAKQIAKDSVRVQIQGSSAAPVGLLSERSPNKLVFDFAGLPEQVASAPTEPSPATAPAPAAIPAPPGLTATQPQAPVAPVAPVSKGAKEQPRIQAPVASAPKSVIVGQAPAMGDLNKPQLPGGVMDPSQPQFKGKAISPPVGDVVSGDIRSVAPTVDLGSKNNITLTLKDAPVSDVLSLLIRRAGLNVVVNDIPPTMTVSLDVKDSPLQETFNFILRLKQLNARRVQQTVFVGTTLPGINQRVARTFRINQATVGDVSTQITALLTGLNLPGGTATVSTDTRTNSVTVVGTPEQLDAAAAKIAQLDVRERQVMINVRVVEVGLNNNSSLGAALSAASGNFAGSGLAPVGGNFGGNPAAQPSGSTGSDPIGANAAQSLNFNTLSRLQQALAIQINAAVTNGTAKILTDPKVVVSQGGNATLNIGSSVVTNQEIVRDAASGLTVTRFTFGTAGVTMALNNARIDDNGFVTVDLQPTVTTPGSPVATGNGSTITPLNPRTTNIQRLRIRDGQTFVLAGLIQDSDTVSVNKVPLLGDIPLLGALFRQQTTTNTRSEVVFLLTPYILRDDTANGLTPVSVAP